MNKSQLPLIAVLLAIIITSVMDFIGYIMFSALALLPITAIFWLISRLRREEMGLKAGRLEFYGLALLYPILIPGLALAAAYASGDLNVTVNWKNILLASSVGILGVLITEEGFFRGWLWGAFRRNKMSPRKTLLVTSIIFTVWHISAVTSGSEYGLPWYQVPIYLVNATFLGLTWGLLRAVSGSVIVPSFCHAVWNALVYELFGFGEEIGSSGITNTILFGPEVGILGIVLNGGFFLWLWMKYKDQLEGETPVRSLKWEE
ncbi:MAG: CPBP family intramembrane glutamic endopeptidase [Cyclobacteriaceae bacterium]